MVVLCCVGGVGLGIAGRGPDGVLSEAELDRDDWCAGRQTGAVWGYVAFCGARQNWLLRVPERGGSTIDDEFALRYRCQT
jgi:hypothetical protein